MPTVKCLEFMDIDNTVRCLRTKGHEGKCCPHERSLSHGKAPSGALRRKCLDCGDGFLQRDLQAIGLLSDAEVLKEVQVLMSSDIDDYVLDEERKRIYVREGVDPEATRAISGCKWERTYQKGELTREVIEIRLHNKLDAIRMAGAHFGLFPSKVGIEDPGKALEKLLGVKKEEMP